MRILVTGGAGYIGSVVTAALAARGDEVWVYDNLSTGHAHAVAPEVPLIIGDVRDTAKLEQVLRVNRIGAVMHFAALSLVGVSVKDPSTYYHNNVVGTLSLLDAMQRAGVDRLVFSSTASVYGEPRSVPIRESDPTVPTSPYGATKLATEQMIRAFSAACGLRHGILRYFNAAGAAGANGEAHDPETHLIPRLLLAAAAGAGVQVYGDDYPTRDGTGVRDYVHVLDLADAHLLLLGALAGAPGGAGFCYNVGCGGEGYSVREVLEVTRRITGAPLPVTVVPRRAGDPAVLIASSDRIRLELGWSPKHDSLEQMVGSAWEWLRRQPGSAAQTAAPR